MTDQRRLFEATAEQYALARHVSCLAEHRDHVGAFLRHPQTADGNILDVAGRALDRLLIGDQTRVADHGRRHIVERDAQVGVLVRQVLHHASQAGFGCRIYSGRVSNPLSPLSHTS